MTFGSLDADVGGCRSLLSRTAVLKSPLTNPLPSPSSSTSPSSSLSSSLTSFLNPVSSLKIPFFAPRSASSSTPSPTSLAPPTSQSSTTMVTPSSSSRPSSTSNRFCRPKALPLASSPLLISLLRHSWVVLGSN